MEMFLFLVTVLQRYDVCLPDGSNVADESLEYIVRCPKPCKVIFTNRQLFNIVNRLAVNF